MFRGAVSRQDLLAISFVHGAFLLNNGFSMLVHRMIILCVQSICDPYRGSACNELAYIVTDD